MDLKEIIIQTTKKALEFYGDSASKRFYEFLSKREFKSTRCKKCGKVSLPPREFCPFCNSDSDIEWIDLPKTGKLFAFTQQERSLRFGKPDCIGIVELEGIGMLLTKIEAPYDKLKIGMDVALDFVDIGGNIILHQFKPV